MNEGNITGLHRIEVGREMAGGQPLHHDRGRRSIVDRIGNRHQRRCRDRDPLSITAGRIDPGDTLAGLNSLDAFADCQNSTDAFDAQDLGIGHVSPGNPLTHADIHEVDPGNRDLDQRLARPGDRLRSLDLLQHLAATGRGHHYCSHVFLLS